MDIRKKYNIPQEIDTQTAKKVFHELLRKFKNKEISVDELSLVTEIINAYPEPNITHTENDPELSQAMDAAMELSYYSGLGDRNNPQYLRFQNGVSRYFNKSVEKESIRENLKN